MEETGFCALYTAQLGTRLLHSSPSGLAPSELERNRELFVALGGITLVSFSRDRTCDPSFTYSEYRRRGLRNHM